MSSSHSVIADLHVPFRPVAQKRHRHTRAGRTYDPCVQEKAEFLRLACLCTCPPSIPPLGPISCTMRFVFARPRSHCNSAGKLRRSAPRQHIYKPDTDNLAKFVLDALNGVFYKDDSQIYKLSIEKKYGEEDSVSVRLQSCAIAIRQ